MSRLQKIRLAIAKVLCPIRQPKIQRFDLSKGDGWSTWQFDKAGRALRRDV